MLKILILMLFFFKIGESYKIVKVTQYYDDLDKQRPIILYDEVKDKMFSLIFSSWNLPGLWTGDAQCFQKEHRESSASLEEESSPWIPFTAVLQQQIWVASRPEQPEQQHFLQNLQRRRELQCLCWPQNWGSDERSRVENISESTEKSSFLSWEWY